MVFQNKQHWLHFTTIPAKMLNQETLLGNLNKGAMANFIVTSGPLFDSSTELHENWGKRKNSYYQRSYNYRY